MDSAVRKGVLGGVLLAILVMLPSLQTVSTSPLVPASQSSFAFAASGDLGNTTQTTTRDSLTALSQAGVDFFIALGDLSYMSPGTETHWCNYIHSEIGDLPFELVSGNHEAGSPSSPGPNGYIGSFASCLPDKIDGLSYNNGYAREYYIDYPKYAPLVRVILISANLTIDGVQYYYTAGSQHYNWVSDIIDGARKAGISWVIVGMHKDCITMGIKRCEIGADLMNLLIAKRVDLVLEGHDHDYQRGKQLTCETMESYQAS